MLDRLRALTPSIVRTVTPFVVGLLVTLAARAGFQWQPSPEVNAIVSTLVGSAWYVIVRLLETRGRRAWGWLIGSPQQPVYVGRRRDVDRDGRPDGIPGAVLPDETVQRGTP